jgi:hypothetical protein
MMPIPVIPVNATTRIVHRVSPTGYRLGYYASWFTRHAHSNWPRLTSAGMWYGTLPPVAGRYP